MPARMTELAEAGASLNQIRAHLALPEPEGFGLDGQPKKFGHGAASAATFSVDVDQKLVVIMTRNKMGKNQGKYGGKFWDALRAGIDRQP